MAVDSEFKRALYGICQGSPDALEVMVGLKSAFDQDEFERMVHYLFERGPRGPSLHVRYRDRCGQDSLKLGRDLLAQASELEGWSNG